MSPGTGWHLPVLSPGLDTDRDTDTDRDMDTDRDTDMDRDTDTDTALCFQG